MKVIKAKQNQTIYDIALEQYGNAEAVAEIMAGNPDLTNDPATLAEIGMNVVEDNGFYMDCALLAGTAVRIDTDSPLMRPVVLRELTNEITTFDL